MVSLRSGKRTTRPSLGKEEENAPSEQPATPRGRPKGVGGKQKATSTKKTNERPVFETESNTPKKADLDANEKPEASDKVPTPKNTPGKKIVEDEIKVIEKVETKKSPRTPAEKVSPKKSEQKASQQKITPWVSKVEKPKVSKEEKDVMMLSSDEEPDLQIITETDNSPQQTDTVETEQEKLNEAPEMMVIDDKEEEEEEEKKAPENIEMGSDDGSEEEKEEEEESIADEEDDDDDMPEEITSKKNPVADVNVELEPVTKPTISSFEKFIAKKEAKKNQAKVKKEDKRMKKKSRRNAKKVSEGVFEIKSKKSKTSFKVVNVKKGVASILEPETNFREELLKARTSSFRVGDTKQFVQRSKWVSGR